MIRLSTNVMSAPGTSRKNAYHGSAYSSAHTNRIREPVSMASSVARSAKYVWSRLIA